MSDVTQSKFFEPVKTILVDHLSLSTDKADAIHADTRLIEDLGADSLDAVEVVMTMEENFGVEISDDVSETMFTVGAIVRFLDNPEAVRAEVAAAKASKDQAA